MTRFRIVVRETIKIMSDELYYARINAATKSESQTLFIAVIIKAVGHKNNGFVPRWPGCHRIN